LKNVTSTGPKANLDLACIYGCEHLAYLDLQPATPSPSPVSGPSGVLTKPAVAVPSLVTVQSIKRQLSSDKLRLDVLQQRHLVQLDWVSMEDGNHILTIAVGSRVLMYAAVSQQISQQALGGAGAQPSNVPSTGTLWKGGVAAMSASQAIKSIRWMKVSVLYRNRIANCWQFVPNNH
jgi:hypothetical protein